MGQGRTSFSDRTRWRLLISEPADGAENMAIDEALLSSAGSRDECVVRIYEWSRPTLSFGRNQTARDRYDVARAGAIGVDFVRRPTGGRTVVHDRELTYSVTAPAGALGPLRASYLRINRLLLWALKSLGVEAIVAPRRMRAPSPGVIPCFDAPGEGEIVVGGRKLVGSAQFRDQGGLLQHGSVLVDGDQRLASDLLLVPSDPPPRPATLRSVLGRAPGAREFADAVQGAIVTLEDAEASAMVVDEALRSRIRRAHSRYIDERWTWRR
jgi:lipoate-protein ligase A